jgi:putative endonuclease
MGSHPSTGSGLTKKDTSWYVYILECEDGSYYVGLTRNLERQLYEHQTGSGAQYTHTHLPVVLKYREIYSNRHMAARRERQLKGWSRVKKQALIDGRLDEL